MIEIEGYIENPDTGEQLPFKAKFKVAPNEKYNCFGCGLKYDSPEELISHHEESHKNHSCEQDKEHQNESENDTAA